MRPARLDVPVRNEHDRVRAIEHEGARRHDDRRATRTEVMELARDARFGMRVDRARRLDENENIGAIFADLLDEQGSEIMMRQAGSYLELGQPLTFYTVTEACRRRNEVAIGYIRKRAGMEPDERNMGGVVVNPRKSEMLSYEAGDRIIVLARD